MFQCIGYGTPDAETPLKPFSFERRDPRPNDVEIAILYCGVCHSDLHQVRNDWQNTNYPCVPGHEIVGRVTRVGADAVVISKDAEAMAAQAERFDVILDTVAAQHDINAYLGLLKRDCTLVQVGAPEKPLDVQVFGVIWRRRNFAGSLIGGIAETQEMLEFCGTPGITADIEMIPIDRIETAYTRMLESDVKYRFVIDMASLPAAA